METVVPTIAEVSATTAPNFSFKSTLQFVRENFAVVSAAAVVVGIALSTLFLFSYLSVFDWHLIWLIQYIDVISFGLVAVGISGTSVFLLNPYLYMWISLKRIEPSGSRRFYFAVAGSVVVILLVWQIWSAIRNSEGYFHIITGIALAGGVIAFIVAVLSHLRAVVSPTLLQVVSLVFLAVIITFESGRWTADLVLETNWFNENVVLKGQTLNNAKLVIMMSRFTVFLKDDVLHVFPTADITEMQTNNKLLLLPK
jgi:hypothetical protein